VKNFALASITLGAVLAATPVLAQDPQKPGVLDAARESLFGDVSRSPTNWEGGPCGRSISLHNTSRYPGRLGK
jgi:hypothetical protein